MSFRFAPLAALLAGVLAATASLAQDASAPAPAPLSAPAESPAPAEPAATAPASEPAAPAGEAPAATTAPGEPGAPLAEPGAPSGDAPASAGDAAATTPVLDAAVEAPAMAEVPAAHAIPEPHDEHAAGEHAEGEAHAEGEHHATNWPATIFNFIVFVAVLWFILHKSVASFFRERKADITGSLAAAEAAQRDSQAKLAETEARLAGLDAQVAEILGKAREQAAAEHALIVEQAKEEAARILSQAEAQVGDLESASVRRLKAVAADLAVEIARELVEKQIQPKDREEIFNRTLTRLQKAAG